MQFHFAKLARLAFAEIYSQNEFVSLTNDLLKLQQLLLSGENHLLYDCLLPLLSSPHYAEGRILKTDWFRSTLGARGFFFVAKLRL